MNTQREAVIPVQIIQEIIWFCNIKEKLSFRETCKLLLNFVDRNILTTVTTTLCGSGEKGCFDGEALTAKFKFPFFGALDSSSYILYVSDNFNDVIRRIDLSSGKVSTLCGAPTKKGFKDGIGIKSLFNCPTGLALNEKEKILYVSDTRN